MIPITIPHYYGLGLSFISVFISITSFLILPISLVIQKYSRLLQERQILLTLLLIISAGTVLIIEFPVSTFYRFVVFYSIVFISSNLIESISSALIAIFIPAFMTKGFFNAGFLIVFVISLGKAIGSALVTLFGHFGIDNIQNAINIFYASGFLIVTYLTFKMYPDLRKRAINRVLASERSH